MVASDLADRTALLSRFGILFDKDLPAFVSNWHHMPHAGSHEVFFPRPKVVMVALSHITPTNTPLVA
jgi:hypothetical protein